LVVISDAIHKRGVALPFGHHPVAFGRDAVNRWASKVTPGRRIATVSPWSGRRGCWTNEVADST
jgi:hypothetical protein